MRKTSKQQNERVVNSHEEEYKFNCGQPPSAERNHQTGKNTGNI
jgi:hypothetical protein